MIQEIYYPRPGLPEGMITVPETLKGMISVDDVSQIAEGLRKLQHKEPTATAVRESAINLANQRKHHRQQL